MSSSSRSSAADVDSSSGDESPHLSALFLVKFDQKVGYTVAWKRSSDDVTIDGAVEFKSLPSGLHTVKKDLVYFVHEDHAGLSAFCNGPATEAERNARFVAVGVLVPLSYGRLGRSWLHAERLQDIASALANSPEETSLLEKYWEEHRLQPHHKVRPSASALKAENSKGKGHNRGRALSTLTAVLPSEQSLPSFHPARAILHYIEVFGPLVFRLQQAALLRKRILFVGAPPVRAMCEFVYNLSVLSSIPNNVCELLSPGTDGLIRLRTLFCLGTHDIPIMEQLGRADSGQQSPEGDLRSHGWVACTTDEIIATKKKLYDVIVEIPHSYDAPPQKRQWPSIRTSDGTQIKASQRDVRRYKLLHHELWKYQHMSANEDGGAESNDDDTTPLVRTESEDAEDEFNEAYDDKGVEPITWSRLAYMGFMWWASAGEEDAYTTVERETDRELLGDLSDYQDGIHTAIIAAFHRSTSALFTHLAGMVEAADDEADREDGEPLLVDKDDISRLGLDTWSEADKAFIQELLWMYFGRRADVHGAALDCCGVRVPVF